MTCAAGAEIVDKCRAQNLLINCTYQTILRLMPAINVTKEQIDKARRDHRKSAEITLDLIRNPVYYSGAFGYLRNTECD